MESSPKKSPSAMPSPELVRHAHIIINPSARRGHPARVIRQIAVEQKRWNAEWTIRVSMDPGGAESLAVEAAKQGAKLVLSAGGDGSLHQVVNGLMSLPPGQRPIVSVLPLGTGNDFAKMLRIPRGVAPALAALYTGSEGSVDVGRAGQRRFINDIGMGLIAQTTKTYLAIPKAVGGSARYVAASLAATAKNWSGRARVLAGDEVLLDGPFSFLAVSNGVWTGGRFKMSPDAKFDDGLLDICWAPPMKRRELIENLPAVVRGKHVHHPDVQTRRAEAIRIESEDLEFFQMDGELREFPREGLEVSVEKGALRFLGAFG